ncbi:MAG TPA: Hsp70 family protein [Anaerolineaceae bacterium]
MKRYITHRSTFKIHRLGREITPQIAGGDYLTALLSFAVAEIGSIQDEIAFAVPVEAFEHYEDWLGRVAESAGIHRFRLIDEPSAAALGYNAHILPGETYLIFDFGGGTMHASIVLMESVEQTGSGRRCRILGKSGLDIGGSSIDQWIFEEILQKCGLRDDDPDVRSISTQLLVEAEHIKEFLTTHEQAEISMEIPGLIQNNSSGFSRTEFENLLDKHDLYSSIHQVVRSAVNEARERGYREEDIKAVLLVGGSSQVPSVQRTLRQIFGKERVMSNRPLDAVARGAAAFISGVDFYDHIQHNYAIRYINPTKGDYDFRVIVPRGTTYPTQEPACRLTIKCSYEGQTRLGLAIFELSEQKSIEPGTFELVFDPSGAARIMPVTSTEQEHRSRFWMNENNLTFLEAVPPGNAGEPRFAVEFHIDINKRLIINARDLRNNHLVLDHYPVVKLV